jgi:hypothetical protein
MNEPSYKLLNPRELLEEGDEYYANGRWIMVAPSARGQPYLSQLPFRRRMTPIAESPKAEAPTSAQTPGIKRVTGVPMQVTQGVEEVVAQPGEVPPVKEPEPQQPQGDGLQLATDGNEKINLSGLPTGPTVEVSGPAFVEHPNL